MVSLDLIFHEQMSEFDLIGARRGNAAGVAIGDPLLRIDAAPLPRHEADR
jgi:hypothetical protein